MGTRIVITEEQYRRLFLGEQYANNDTKKDPFTHGQQIRSRWEQWDRIEPYLEEKISYLADNYYSNVFEPVLKNINKTYSKKLTYQNYDNPPKIDDYEEIWKIVSKNYSWVIPDLNKQISTWEKEREKKLVLKPEEISNVSNLFTLAQNGWEKYGAPNPKTGYDKISQEDLEILKSQIWGDEEKTKGWSPSSNPALYSDPTGGLNLGYQEFYKRRQNWEIEKGDHNKPYTDALAWNKLIDNQKTLIPQWCKKNDRLAWNTINDGDNPKSEEEYKRQDDRMKSGGWTLHRRGWLGAGTGKYGFKSVYKKNKSESAFDFCNNDRGKGVFVWNVQDKAYYCGCINPEIHDESFLSDEGGTSTMSRDLNIDNSVSEQLKPGFLEFIGNCFSDYHCVMDLASIAVLAIPGVGMIASAGIDFLNAGLYGVEAFFAKTDEERDAAIIAAGLTLVGGFMGGGVKQTRKLITHASAKPKIYNYVNDVLKTVNKEQKYFDMLNIDDVTKNARIRDIYADAASKYGLNQSDKIIAAGILNDFSKIDPSLAAKYSKALNGIKDNLSATQRASLTQFASEKGFQTVVEENGGDVVVGLNKYMRTKAGKEALVEAGLFIVLSEVMEIPEVQQWIGQKISDVKVTLNSSIKNVVVADGYSWDATKQFFGSDGSKVDNGLLEEAWLSGWRPYPKYEKEPNQSHIVKSDKWLTDHPEFQTETFKKRMREKYGMLKRKIQDKNIEGNEKDKERDEKLKKYKSEKPKNIKSEEEVLNMLDDIIGN